MADSRCPRGGRPAVQRQLPTCRAGSRTAGRVTGFAVVVPKGVPADWHGSSFSVTAAPGTPDAPPTARGGWLVPSGAYVTLIESSGDPAVVLEAELGQTSGATTGSVTAGGASWTVGPGRAGRNGLVAHARTASPW